jgi:hypothetical protein
LKPHEKEYLAKEKGGRKETESSLPSTISINSKSPGYLNKDLQAKKFKGSI